MDKSSEDPNREEHMIVDLLIDTIRIEKKSMDSEINKGGLIRFINETMQMNNCFCSDLDYPEKRMEMQIDTFREAIDNLTEDRDQIVGRAKTIPFNPLESTDEEFHTDCFQRGTDRYHELLNRFNPNRDLNQGVTEIRATILSRLVYGCLRSEDVDDACQTISELSMRLFMFFTKKLARRSRQTPEERFREAVGRYDGKGFDKDPEYAISMLLDLVDMGYPPAMNYIGAMYFNGEYFEEDKKRGFEMINTAAGMGFPKSMLNLSRMYRDGDYVKKSIKKADEYEMRAVEMRYLPAIIKHEMRIGEISRESVKALIGFAMDHGAMEM